MLSTLDIPELEIIRDCLFHSAAKIPTLITHKLVAVTNKKYLKLALNTKNIVGIVTTADLSADVPDNYGLAITKNPISILWKIHSLLGETKNYYWKDFESRISHQAQISDFACIPSENVTIGKNSVVSENVVIAERTIIGDDVFIGPNTTIGTNAFEIGNFDGAQHLIKSVGGVYIGNNSKILSNVAIARSCFPAFTVIKDNVFVDNLVHIAHDCQIEESVKIIAGSVISGRVNLHRNVMVGGNVVIANGLTVGENSRVSLGSVVIEDVPSHETVTGNFAVRHFQFIRNHKRQFSS